MWCAIQSARATLTGGACNNLVLADGTPCDDGTVCNGDETCQAGLCAGGTPLNCDDGDACTIDSCHPINGCSNTPIPGC